VKRSTFRVTRFFVHIVTVLLLAVIILDFGLYVGSEAIFTLVARPITEYTFWMPPFLGLGALAALVTIRTFHWLVLVLLERYGSVEYRQFGKAVASEDRPASTQEKHTDDLEGTSPDGS